MKKLLTLGVLVMAITLAGCVNTNPTEEVVMEPVAEEVVTPVVEEAPVVEEMPVAEEVAAPAAEEMPVEAVAE